MLTRGVYYLAAFVVASAAVVGYAVFNQLPFPVVCAMMILLTSLLALASDVSGPEAGHNGRLQTSTTVSNHTHMPSPVDASYSRVTLTTTDANNSNCIQAHSDVQLSSYGVGSATISSSSRRFNRDAECGPMPPLPRSTEAEQSNRVELFGEVGSQTELHRPPLGGSYSVAVTDSTETLASTFVTPSRTSVTPSRSDLRTCSSSSRQHVLPQFHRLTTGCVLLSFVCGVTKHHIGCAGPKHRFYVDFVMQVYNVLQQSVGTAVPKCINCQRHDAFEPFFWQIPILRVFKDGTVCG